MLEKRNLGVQSWGSYILDPPGGLGKGSTRQAFQDMGESCFGVLAWGILPFWVHSAALTSGISLVAV